MKIELYHELQGQLSRLEFVASEVDGENLSITFDGKALCVVGASGEVHYHEEDVSGDERFAALERVIDISRSSVQYLRLLDSAPLLTADGLDGDYRLLAEFNDTVLAGHPTRLGVQFITWQRTYDGTGLWQGHYYHQDYKAAKEDFAIRAGLVSREKLFSPEQLTEVYRCIHETLESEYPITQERTELLKRLKGQIERSVPDLQQRVERSNQQEIEADEIMQSPTM